VLGLHYQMAWPNREFETGRGMLLSPLHDRLAARGACFGVKNGWERPNWFARRGVAPVTEYSFERQNWFACHAAEHRAAREAVAVFDQTGFSKFILKGPDALEVLQRLCGNNIDVACGRVVYTGLFNERGGFESDLTLIRVAPEEFMIITGTAQTTRDFDWIQSHIDAGGRAALVDVTRGLSIIGVMGPQARVLLGRLTETDLSNAAFPFLASRVIDLGRATVRATRITYVGELGWELQVAADQAAGVYDEIIRAGSDLGVTDAGHYAINSLRLEKGYRAWGAELSPDDTPIEAGLEFALDWSKPFLGREALARQKREGVKRRLAVFVLEDPEPVLWGGEPIHRNGISVGHTTSGAYGHTLGAAVAMGYVNDPNGVSGEFVTSGSYEINIAGRLCPARAWLRGPLGAGVARL
jgi:4-methylaminobutanoate oxidase (formaldehyde-forming)